MAPGNILMLILGGSSTILFGWKAVSTATDSESQCGGLSPSDIDIYKCHIAEAHKTKSVEPCNNIPEDFCWTGEEGSGNLSYLAIGNVRDNCYSTTASIMRDPGVCDLIEHQESACFPDDFLYRWKDRCYSELADDIDEIGLCNKISSERLRKSCIRTF